MGEFRQPTNDQFAELIRRGSPHHPQRIPRALLQTFLEGRMIAPEDVERGDVVDLRGNVDRLIGAGFHKAADMEEAAYRALWPEQVELPAGYYRRFPLPLLLDQTLSLAKLLECTGVPDFGQNGYASFASKYEDLTPVLTGDDDQPLERCIVFIHDGVRFVGQVSKDVLGQLARDEYVLRLAEGLQVAVQFPKVLASHSFHALGTTQRQNSARPVVDQYEEGSIQIGGWSLHKVYRGGRGLSVVSRGGYVIPIT